MTNQFMQDGLTYLTNKSYQRGLRHSVYVTVIVAAITALMAFHAGRTYQYVQTVEQAQEAMAQLPMVGG